jgi:hypothetical protein
LVDVLPASLIEDKAYLAGNQNRTVRFFWTYILPDIYSRTFSDNVCHMPEVYVKKLICQPNSGQATLLPDKDNFITEFYQTRKPFEP